MARHGHVRRARGFTFTALASIVSGMKRVSLIPYDCGAGGLVPGSEFAAQALKKAGLEKTLQKRGIDASWLAEPAPEKTADDLPAFRTPEREDIVFRHCKKLCDNVAQVAATGGVPVSLGGDHAMAIGSVAGLAKARQSWGRTGLLWIDAHPDVHTPETSRRGSLHGMPVATLLGHGAERFSALSGKGPVLKPEHVFFIGLRSIDSPEIGFMVRNNMRMVTNGDLDQISFRGALEAAAEALGKLDTLFLSLDVDVCDPSFAPGTGTPVPGGLARGELLEGLSWLTKTLQFHAFEIAEYNPLKDKRKMTAKLCADILTAMLSRQKV